MPKHLSAALTLICSFLLAFFLMTGPLNAYVGYLSIYGYTSLTWISLVGIVVLTLVFFQLGQALLARKISKSRLTFLYLLYALILSYSLFFKSIGVQGIDLNPLSFVSDFLYGQGFLLLANLLLFVPLGLLVPFKVKHLLIFFLLISLVESLQYLLHLGICDLGDIVLNTLGFALGSLVHKSSWLQALITDQN